MARRRMILRTWMPLRRVLGWSGWQVKGAWIVLRKGAEGQKNGWIWEIFRRLQGLPFIQWLIHRGRWEAWNVQADGPVKWLMGSEGWPGVSPVNRWERWPERGSRTHESHRGVSWDLSSGWCWVWGCNGTEKEAGTRFQKAGLVSVLCDRLLPGYRICPRRKEGMKEGLKKPDSL